MRTDAFVDITESIPPTRVLCLSCGEDPTTTYSDGHHMQQRRVSLIIPPDKIAALICNQCVHKGLHIRVEQLNGTTDEIYIRPTGDPKEQP